YVRAGSIVPEQPVVQHTREVPEGPLELRVFPGPSCAGELYADDGESFAYQRGELFRARFSCDETADRVTITLRKHDGPDRPWFTGVRLTVYGKTPHEVRCNGSRLDGWSARQGAIALPELDWPAQPQDVELAY